MEPTEIKSKLSAGYFFLSLGVLITLITSVVAFINLAFETLAKRFPDVLNANYMYGYATGQFEGIRMALSTLIIFFPIFLIVTYYWKKRGNEEMGSVDQIIRKWLIYIILFLSALVLAIDLVVLIRYFISGEITTRFILKVLVVLAVASIIGKYFILELRGNIFGFKVKRKGLIFGLVSTLLIIAAVFWSFSIMGSPKSQRMQRLDDRRVGDLQSLQYQVINFWQQKERLPNDLKELSTPISSYALPVDPEFEKGKSYEYAVNKEKKMTFELCATFSAPMPKGWQEYGGNTIRPISAPFAKEMAVTSYPGGGINESWDHQAGKTCFERTIDPEIYPPFPKTKK